MWRGRLCLSTVVCRQSTGWVEMVCIVDCCIRWSYPRTYVSAFLLIWFPLLSLWCLTARFGVFLHYVLGTLVVSFLFVSATPCLSVLAAALVGLFSVPFMVFSSFVVRSTFRRLLVFLLLLLRVSTLHNRRLKLTRCMSSGLWFLFSCSFLNCTVTFSY